MENRLTAYGNYLAGTEKADNTTALYIREAAASPTTAPHVQSSNCKLRQPAS